MHMLAPKEMTLGAYVLLSWMLCAKATCWMSYRRSMRGDVVFGPWLTLAPMQQQRCNASECRPSWGVSTHPARRYIRGVHLLEGFNGNRPAINSRSIISRLYGVSLRPAVPTRPYCKGHVCEGLRRVRQTCTSNPVLSLLKCIAPLGRQVAASCTGNRCIVARCPVGLLDVDSAEQRVSFPVHDSLQALSPS